MLLVKVQVGDICPPAKDVEKAPPVGHGGQERAGVLVEAVVVSVLNQPCYQDCREQRQPVLEHQANESVRYSVHLLSAASSVEEEASVGVRMRQQVWKGRYK